MAKKDSEKLTVVSSEPVALDGESSTNEPTVAGDAKTEPSGLDVTEKADSKATTTGVTSADGQPKEEEKKESETKDTQAAQAPDTGDDDAPPPPPRPVSPVTQITNELKEAFPNIDAKYVTAVLVASEGKVDLAFNALLYLSDPTFKPVIPIPSHSAPAPPPKDLTDDEKLARKLQKEFAREERRQRAARDAKRQGRQPAHQDLDDSDDFGQIKESFAQGFEEARTTLNGWVSGLARKFQDEPSPQTGSSQSPKLFGALGGSSFNSGDRKSGYDRDPEIISNDFHTKISMKDELETAPQLPKRQESKWQPLNPDVPVNSDAFLVTDSDDEEEGKKK